MRLAYVTRVEESFLSKNLPILVLPWSWAEHTSVRNARDRQKKMNLFKRAIDKVRIKNNGIEI